MASQKLQQEITALGGQCYGDECLRFGFEAKTNDDAKQIDDFYTRYSDVLELDPESTETTIIFRLNATKLTELPKELLGTVFSYIPESEMVGRFEGIKELEFAKQYAIENRPSLTAVVKESPEFYQYLQEHKHLKSLTLENPQGSTLNLSGVMEAIGNLQDLEELKIGELNLTDLENVEFLANTLDLLPSLVSLDLYGSQLDDDGVRILASHLSRLTSLNIGGNPLMFEGIQALIPTFEHLTTLGFANVNNDDVHGFEEIFPLFKNITQLTSLDLSDNNFQTEEMAALAELLSHLPNLTSLDLDRNYLNNAAVETLRPGLESLIQLESVKLKASDSIAAIALADIIGQYPNLKSLHLDFSREQPEQIANFTQHLAISLTRTPHLEELDIFETIISRDDFDHLIPILQHLPLTLLRMGLEVPKMESMSNLFDVLPSLKNLGLQFSGASSKDVITSFQHLPPLDTLTIVNLALGFSTSNLLSDVLIKFPNLQHLRFRRVRFTDREGFLPGLATLKHLRSLEMIQCEITRTKFDLLAPVISQMKNLESLDLDDLDLGSRFFKGGKFSTDDDGIIQLVNLIQSLPSLRDFHFSNLKIRYDDEQALKRYFAEIFPDLHFSIF